MPDDVKGSPDDLPEWVRKEVDDWVQRLIDDRQIDKLEDGYYYFFPQGSGALSADQLLVLSIKLDEMNAEWDATVAKALAALPPAPISMEGFELTEPPAQSPAAS